MEEFMTTKQLAEVSKVDVSTIQKIAKKLYPQKKRKRGKDTLYNKEESEKIIEETRKKGFIALNGNYPLCNGKNPLANENFSLLFEIKNLIENQNKIIAEISQRIEKLENQKALPKPATNDSGINVNYEWLYPSRLAKYLECKTKWIYDALYQLQLVSVDKFTGSCKITEKGSECLRWANGSLMVKSVLIEDIKKIINIWKKNSTNLF